MNAGAAPGESPVGLLRLADAFQFQSGVLRSIMNADGPACPDGGAEDLDQALRKAAQLLGLLHEQLTVVTGQQARALRAAAAGTEPQPGPPQGGNAAPGQPASGTRAVAAAREPTPLAPLPQQWTGGDIRGLSMFAGVLCEYVRAIYHVVAELDGKFSELAGAEDRQDGSARALRTAWDHDAAAARAVGRIADRTAEIVDQLAVRLAQIESQLEDAAAQARSHGVRIGADGTPPAERSAQVRSMMASTWLTWAASYQDTHERSLLAAAQARQEAADAIMKYARAATSDEGIRLSDAIALAEGSAPGQPLAPAPGDLAKRVNPILAVLLPPGPASRPEAGPRFG
jgi:hypothetical protein